MREGLPLKHGILVLHGAGTPEDQESLVGDPLSRSANGLIDHLNGDKFLNDGRRLTVSTGPEGADLEKR